MRKSRSAVGPALAVLAFTCLAAAARAQKVDHDNSTYGLEISGFRRDAEDADIANYPNLTKDESGTVVGVDVSYREASIDIITSRDISEEMLLSQCRSIANKLNFPEADFVTGSGIHTIKVEIDLKKYIQSEGSTHRFTLHLGMLKHALDDQPRLPKPVFVHIDGSDAEKTMLDSGRGTESFSNTKTFALAEVPEAGTAQFSTRLTAMTWVVGLLTATLFYGLFLVVFIMPWAVAFYFGPKWQAKAKLLELKKPLSPVEVQAAYDKRRAFSGVRFVPLAMIPILLLFTLGAKHGIQALDWLGLAPPLGTNVMLPFMGVMMVNLMAGFGVGRAVQRKRAAKLPEAEKIVQPPDPLQRMMLFMIIPLGWIIVAGMIMRLIPALSKLNHDLRFAFLMVPGFLGAGIAFYLTKGKAKVFEPFLPGDRWYEAAMAMGHKVGVRIRKVLRTPAKNANASASIFGTVQLTQGLIDQFDYAEINAVLAHEVGHLRHNHVRRNFAITMILTFAAISAQIWAENHFRKNMSFEARALINSPIFGMFLLPLLLSLLLGPARRRAELEADRFALEETRDPDLVIRALTKIHDLNMSPHRLKPLDEAIASHPSLDKRVASLRKIAAEMGLETPV